MKKEFWVRADQDLGWDERKRLVTTALESGVDVVLVKPGEVGRVKTLGRINVAGADERADITVFSDLSNIKKTGKETAFYREIRGKSDEREIALAGKKVDYVLVKATDWRIIPLENLIAELKDECRIIVEISRMEEAKVALQTLEVGADGVLVNVNPENAPEIKGITVGVNELTRERLTLKPVTVTGIEQVGMGSRVCIDTCSIFNVGEGVLVGPVPDKMLLLHSEIVKGYHLENYLKKYSFRVSIDKDAYTRTPDKGICHYNELSYGDEILGVDYEGRTRGHIIDRIKTKKQRLMLIEVEFNREKVKMLLAETSELVNLKGVNVNISKLTAGEEVLGYY